MAGIWTWASPITMSHYLSVKNWNYTSISLPSAGSTLLAERLGPSAPSSPTSSPNSPSVLCSGISDPILSTCGSGPLGSSLSGKYFYSTKLYPFQPQLLHLVRTLPKFIFLSCPKKCRSCTLGQPSISAHLPLQNSSPLFFSDFRFYNGAVLVILCCSNIIW